MTDDTVKADGIFLPGNTAPDGSYLVGRNKPPESGKFRANDGRPRGRRAKGTKNLATDIAEELAALVTVSINGQQKRVTRQRSIVMRAMDKASRGENPAIRMVLSMSSQLESSVTSASAETQSGEGVATLYPNLSDLTDEENRELDRLLHKAAGQPYAPAYLDHPLAYVRDPSDERNYYYETTLDGVYYRRCHIESVPDEIVEVRNRAYFSAALPRRTGCYQL